LDEPHFWSALRYVERNPVRAGIVARAEDYFWSSARAHCGLCDDPFLAPLPPRAALIGNWSAWLAEVDVPSQLDQIRNCTKTGRPCGSESFLRGLELTTGRILIPRQTGRPRNNEPAIPSCPGPSEELQIRLNLNADDHGSIIELEFSKPDGREKR
jgi:putative transposase